MNFLEAVENRRSRYAIDAEVTIGKEEIINIVQRSVKHAPSAFNIQSAKAVVLFEKESDRLWDLVADAMRGILPESALENTLAKLDSFKAGYGTILFFDDTALTESLEKEFPAYAKNFRPWAEQANGIVQYIVWTALSEVGLGATLQHYSELIEDKVKESWNLPSAWRLIAQMPFGRPTAPANEKEFAPIDERVKIFGA